MIEINEIESLIGYSFKNKELIKLAFVHSSFGKPNNERLEFLGDAILDMVVADILFSRIGEDEGSLSKKRATLVCEKNLSQIIKDLDLCKFVKFGNSFKNSPSNAICADLFESIVGAIYLDNNHSLVEVKEFILRNMDMTVCSAIDYKTSLQEIIQKNKDAKLKYSTMQTESPPNKPKFECELFINDELYSKGEGGSKKEAERNAARDAYERLERLAKNDI